MRRDPLNLNSASSSYRDVSTIEPLAWQRERCRSPPHTVSRFKQIPLGSYRACSDSARPLFILRYLVESSKVRRQDRMASTVVIKNGNGSMARERSKHGDGKA